MRKFELMTAAMLAMSAMAAQGQDSAETRGKYLVEEVAKCQDCHTARSDKGELDTAKWLKGATLDFQPIQPMPGWHKTSPDLTSTGRIWKRWGDEKFVRFLTTGLGPSGHAADAPMPAYKLTEEDAKAVVAYLKTLK